MAVTKMATACDRAQQKGFLYLFTLKGIWFTEGGVVRGVVRRVVCGVLRGVVRGGIMATNTRLKLIW